jgi:hypothetical protein
MSPRRGWSRSPHRSTRQASRSASPEPPEDILTPDSAKEKGKAKEPPAADVNGDIKMREIPSLPKQPKNYRKSPPTGPRNLVPPPGLNPASPATTFAPPPPTIALNPWETNPPSPAAVEPSVVAGPVEPVSAEPVIGLPAIPVYVPVASVSAELGKQVGS